jgi:hypothetical protein
MSRKQNPNKLPPFVPLTWEMLNHKAYKSLTGLAAKALPYFFGKIKTLYKDPQRYLEHFQFSYTEAQTYGFSRSTFSRIICELIGKGFIDPVERGGLRGFGRSFNKFRLSERWKRYGKGDFEKKNWKTIPPPDF